MKTKYFIISMVFVSLLAIKSKAQEDKLKGGIFVETQKYNELINLNPPTFPEGVAKNINFIHIGLSNVKGKTDDTPYYVTEGSVDKNYINSVYFAEPNYSSITYYENRATEYRSMASNSSDPSRRSYYSGMAQTYSATAQNQLMIQQSFNRAINTVQMYNTISNTLNVLASALYKRWIISDMNNAIQYGFGSPEPLYSQDENDPELIINFIDESNSPKKAPFYYRLIVEAKVTYNDETIALPSQAITVKHIKKKYLKNGVPEGFVNVRNAEPPIDHLSIVKNYWQNHYFALLLRQIAHDYKALTEALLADSE